MKIRVARSGEQVKHLISIAIGIVKGLLGHRKIFRDWIGVNILGPAPRSGIGSAARQINLSFNSGHWTFCI